MNASRLAWLSRVLQEMDANAREQWHSVEAVILLEVEGTDAIMGDGFDHSRRCRLGRVLASCKGVEAAGFVLDAKRDSHNHSRLYRASPARPPTVSSVSVSYGDARRELAELRAEVVAWQRVGEALRERMAVLDAELARSAP